MSESNSLVRSLRAIAVLIAFLWGLNWVWGRLPDSSGKDNVNQAASAFGVSIIPWEDRATTALRTMLAGASGQTIAESVQATLHPSGKRASLAGFDVTKAGSSVVVHLVVNWRGGLLGGSYQTALTWRLSRERNFGLVVTADSGPFGYKNDNLQQLQNYFEASVYPVLLANTGE